MNTLNLKTTLLAIFCFGVTNTTVFAQEGHVSINQDQKISQLLNLKKEMNSNETHYKIQIYNGNRADAYKAQTEFKSSFNDWRSEIKYESPNFKIWIGNFRTRLEADRAIKRIKKKFPSAFIFKPKKKTS